MAGESLCLSSVAKSFVKRNIIITNAGDEPAFSVYKYALVSHFMKTPSVWKRNGKVFPHLIKFPLEFVNFNEALCYSSSLPVEKVASCAFLHIFVINVATADEYKTSVRHNVSEWFAKVNPKQDVNWMIVVNTSRGRDKKTRSGIWDRIKSDFSKHHSKLIELSDTSDHGSFMNLVNSVQSSLFLHLNIVVDTWDKAISSGYLKRNQPDWDASRYILSMLDYGRFFWSLGAVEHASSILNDIDTMFLESFLSVSESSENKFGWIGRFATVPIDNRPSPMTELTSQNVSPEADNYLTIRNHILVQHVIVAISLYQQKLKSEHATPSLRPDCSAGILKYVLVTMQQVMEYNILVQNKKEKLKYFCWVMWTVDAAFEISSLLVDVNKMDIALDTIANLHMLKFDMLANILEVATSDENELNTLRMWLEKNKSAESTLVLTMINSTQNLMTEIEKVFDTSISFLLSCNRKRQALYLVSQLLDAYKKANVPPNTQKLHFILSHRKLCNLLPAHVVRSIYQSALDVTEVNETILSLLLFLAQNDNTRDDATKFIDLLKKEGGACFQLNRLQFIEEPLIKFVIQPFEAIRSVESTVELILDVTSDLTFDLEDSRIVLEFTTDAEANPLQNRENLSVLKGAVEVMENGSRVARLLPPWKLKIPEQKSESDIMKLEMTSGKVTLKPGMNRIIIKGVMSEMGCFILSSIKLESLDGKLTFEPKVFESRRPAALFVVKMPHVVTVTSEQTPCIAGLRQKLSINFEARMPIPNSEAVFRCTAGQLRFWDEISREWAPEKKIEIDNDGRKQVDIYVWLPIDSHMSESLSIQKRTLSIDWLGRHYNHVLPFVPIVVINSHTSMLQTSILLEVEVNRLTGEGYRLEIFESQLIATELDGTETPAGQLSPLPLFCDFAGSVNLVWRLPVTGPNVKHKFAIKYRVYQDDDDPFKDVTYQLDDDLELSVPLVDFEVCTQISSHQPGAQLCRAGAACDFVISTRCLTENRRNFFVVIHADERMWTLTERTKLMTVKESGLGQVALGISPNIAGFLPYPSVSIYHLQESSVDGDFIPGKELLCFDRTGGRQIRVLSSNIDQSALAQKAGNKITRKIVQLFD